MIPAICLINVCFAIGNQFQLQVLLELLVGIGKWTEDEGDRVGTCGIYDFSII